jgi:AraC-like DNA-binding protein
MSHASVYCTQTVNSRDRFAFWSEVVCNSFVQLGCDTTKRSGFTGRLETVQHSCISVAHVSGSSHRVERHVLMRARSFIAAHLGDPDLDRTRVAAELGMSLRRLNDIFAKDGLSVAHEIRNARLSSVALDLVDPRFAGLTISEIAIKNGLWNLQHFSTLFRTAYGQSPKTYRALSEQEAQQVKASHKDQFNLLE